MPRWPYSKPLPQYEGPKLHPFKDCNSKVDFRRLLSDEDSEDSGHAHVFEVSIESVVYALKVFKFFDSSADFYCLLPEEKETFSPSLVHAHMDPFYNECRAYGRLIDKEMNGKIAVHCYGHMTLSATAEIELEQRFNITTWDRSIEDDSKPISKRAPLRAIVKTLIEDDINFTVRDVRRMLRDLRHLHRLGIYVADIKERNYRAGTLIDFSCAMTKPHYLLQTRPKSQLAQYLHDDLRDFDTMVEEAGFETSIRATRNPYFTERLRVPPSAQKTFVW